MTKEQILLGLQQEYALRREENQRLYEQRVDEACARCPGLRQLLDARHAALMAGVRGVLYLKQKDARGNESMSATMADYNARIAALMREHSVDAALVQPVFTCNVCKDEGYIYTPSRHLCACMEGELNRRLLQSLDLQQGAAFEQFDARIFSQELVPQYGVSPRQLAEKYRDICETYADTFPAPPCRDLLLMGKSGLGKTFLLQCIARRVAARGFGVRYISAYRLLEQARSAYFSNDSELIRPLLETPLLLIDDLGTEPLMENITVTQFFNLFNERQNAGLHTIVSTNLSFEELRKRYTERITSRLMKGPQCRHLTFIGEDVRRHAAPVGGDV